MRRFLITSPNYDGEAELHYDPAGRLVKIDLANTDMSLNMVAPFKARVPPCVDGLQEAFKDTKAAVVETSFEISMEDFIRDYPYKRNTHLIPDIWRKMSTADQVLAWKAAGEYRKYCQRNQTWYKPKIAVTWLKTKEYLNNWREL